MSKFDEKMIKPFIVLIAGMFTTLASQKLGMIIILASMIYLIILTVVYCIAIIIKQNKNNNKLWHEKEKLD